MSDPKYNTYAGELRFDDDNIVDVNLEPDTENITVKLNGVEITSGGGDLPEVDSGDNGKVLTVVEGEWAAATQAAELPAVSGADNGDVLTVVEGAWAKAAPAALPAVSATDNGDVLTVVEGSWAKAAPADEIVYIPVEASWSEIDDEWVGTSTYTTAQVLALIAAGKRLVVAQTYEQDPLDPGDDITNYAPLFSINATTSTAIFTAVQFENGSFGVMRVKFTTGVSPTIITLDFREITLS